MRRSFLVNFAALLLPVNVPRISLDATDARGRCILDFFFSPPPPTDRYDISYRGRIGKRSPAPDRFHTRHFPYPVTGIRNLPFRKELGEREQSREEAGGGRRKGTAWIYTQCDVEAEKLVPRHRDRKLWACNGGKKRASVARVTRFGSRDRGERRVLASDRNVKNGFRWRNEVTCYGETLRRTCYGETRNNSANSI